MRDFYQLMLSVTFLYLAVDQTRRLRAIEGLSAHDAPLLATVQNGL